jgi:predicted transposase YbfD/YdcC
LAAFLQGAGTVVRQIPVDRKTNAIPCLPDRLAPVDLTGAIVTADALHTQRETARYLVDEKRAHYLLPVKENQPTLWEACQAGDPDDFSPSGGPAR